MGGVNHSLKVFMWLVLIFLSIGHFAAAQTYTAENRTINSSGIDRTFVLSRPTIAAGNLPLVFSLHGDGGTGASMRSALNLETPAAGSAAFVYPNAPGGTFEYYSDSGRAREMQFVRDVINALEAELQIDRTRVFIAGFSGGATMANALGCRMESDEIRGLGIHSGSLYPINNDFTYTGNGGVSCALPATILVWGENDSTSGVTFAIGQGVRDNHRNTQSCGLTSQAFAPSPCIEYDSCSKDVAWCAIPAMGHSIWSQAAIAMWNFFSAQTAPPPPSNLSIYSEQLDNAWQDYSWGTVNFAAQPAQSGLNAVRFDAHSFQGLSFARPATPIQTSAWPALKFWIRGNVGGESLDFSLQSGNTIHANTNLSNLLAGGITSTYREVVVRFSDPPLNYSGTFERINLQDTSGNSAGAAQTVFVDGVTLVAGTTPIGDVFSNGFE